MRSMTVLFNILQKVLSGHQWLDIVKLMVISSVASVMIAIMPLVLGTIVTLLTENQGRYTEILYLLFILAVIYVVILSASKLSGYWLLKIQSFLRVEIIRNLSIGYFRGMFHKEAQEFRRKNSGRLSQELNQASNEIYILLRKICSELMPPLVQLCTALVIIVFSGDSFSAVLFLLYAAMFVVINIKLTSKIVDQRTKMMKSSVMSYEILTDSLNNIMASKKNNNVVTLTERYSHRLENERSDQRAYWQLTGRQVVINAMLGILLFSLIFFYNLYGVQSGTVSLGHFVMIVSYIMLLSTPVENIGMLLSEVRQSVAALDKFFSAHDIEIDGKAAFDPCPPDDFDIRLTDVSHRYGEGETALAGVSLEIAHGEFVTITGESGSGKSTLAAILTGTEESFQGEVTLGDISIKEFGSRDINDFVYLVTQDEYIFMDSLRFNLLIANPNASDADMYQALKLAGLSTVNNKPVDLALEIGNRGETLSGGQKQRLSLARMFLRSPKVIILDEATSSLDHDNERNIYNNIKSIFPAATVINITHNSSLLELSDYIYIMSDGKIADRGTFDDLRHRSEYVLKMLERPMIEAG